MTPRPCAAAPMRADDSQPVQRLASLILSQAIFDHAERLEISLDDIASDTGVRFAVSVRGSIQQLAPASGRLFEPLVVVFCNYAGVAYYSKGCVEGTIETQRPRSSWRLQSDDLRRAIVLLRVSPIPPLREFRPIDWGT